MNASQCDKTLQKLGSRLIPKVSTDDSETPRTVVTRDSLIDDVYPKKSIRVGPSNRQSYKPMFDAIRATLSLADYETKLTSFKEICEKTPSISKPRMDSSCENLMSKNYKIIMSVLLNSEPKHVKNWPSKEKWARATDLLYHFEDHLEPIGGTETIETIQYIRHTDSPDIFSYIDSLEGQSGTTKESKANTMNLIGDLQSSYLLEVGTSSGERGLIGYSATTQTANVIVFKKNSCEIANILYFHTKISKKEVAFQEGCRVVALVLREYGTSRYGNDTLEQHQELLTRTFRSYARPFDNISELYARSTTIKELCDTFDLYPPGTSASPKRTSKSTADGLH